MPDNTQHKHSNMGIASRMLNFKHDLRSFWPVYSPYKEQVNERNTYCKNV